MDRKFSVPLSEPPSFLSTISMVVDDRTEIIDGLTRAEMKSPSRYAPSRDLFCSVLQGDFSIDQAIVQARRLNDPIERKCAVEVLQASSDFLRSQLPAPVGRISKMQTILPNGLHLDVSPIWLRRLAPERLMVLHFWETALTGRQMSAAAAVLRNTVGSAHPEYSECEIDFISVSVVPSIQERKFQCRDWKSLQPLNNNDLMRFWKLFCDAWTDYKKRGPRAIKTKRAPDMFGRT